MRLYLMAFAMVGVLHGCASSPPPTARVYTPRFQTIAFDFMERYRVSHDYLIGPGVKQCRYVRRKVRTEMEEGYQVVYASDYGPFVERDGIPHQWGRDLDRKPRLFSLEGSLIGSPSKSLLDGQEHWYWNFVSLCSDWVGAHNYVWQIRKSSSLSIEQSIQSIKNLDAKFWSETSRWEPEQKVMRNGNTWVVFKEWNRAIYTADASEEWFLPIGDGTYYIYAVFAYRSAEPEVAPEQYARARAAFDHIIDSVKIEPLK